MDIQRERLCDALSQAEQGIAGLESTGAPVAQRLGVVVHGPEVKFVEERIGDLVLDSHQKTPDAESLDECLGGKRACLLCLTPRSGSTYLSTLMESTGQLGSCLEFMNFEDIQLRGEHHSFGCLSDYLKHVINRHSSASGVFSMKGDLYHYLPLIRRGLLRRGLQRVTLVYLTREDVLAQAISNFRAIQTGQWSSLQVAQRPPQFEAEGILAQVDALLQMMSRWELIFTMLGLKPIRLTYEGLVAEPAGAVQLLARSCGVTVGSAINSPLKIQRDDVSLDWAERMREAAAAYLKDPIRFTERKKGSPRKRGKIAGWWANCWMKSSSGRIGKLIDKPNDCVCPGETKNPAATKTEPA